MVNAFLTQPIHSSNGTANFVQDLVEGDGLQGVGGFSLVCGEVGEPLAIISNRTPNVEEIVWIAKGKGETIGLSNAIFGDRSWPKVIKGEALLSSAIRRDISEPRSQASFIEELFRILTEDALPRKSSDVSWDEYVHTMRTSIFIPMEDESKAEDLATGKGDQHINVENVAKLAETTSSRDSLYGTQKQTIVLVNRQGRVTLVERTLYDASGRTLVTTDRDRSFRFDIEGWNSQEGF